MTKAFVGIDFGGSSLKAVRVDQDGQVLHSHVAPASGTIPREALAEAARLAVAQVTGSEPFNHIGLAFGGAIQPDGTMLVNSTNLPNKASCLEDYHSGLAIKIGAHGALAGAVGAASLWRDDTH